MTRAMPPGIVASRDDPAALAAITRAGVALAIWPRPLPDALRAPLADLDLAAIDDLSCDLDAAAVPDAPLRNAGYPARVAAPLAADIGVLLRRHAALTGADLLHLRLEVVETDACRRFHADHVTLRLLCSYIGRGTQWCRSAAAEAIAELPTGAVAVFKGRLLLDPPPLLHRSPPIAGTGARRLVLAIDPLRDRASPFPLPAGGLRAGSANGAFAAGSRSSASLRA